MTLKDLDRPLLETVLMHELFLRMGFDPAELQTVVAPVRRARMALLYELTSDRDQCWHVGVTQGERGYLGPIGPVGAGQEASVAWLGALDAFSHAGALELEDAWRGSRVATMADVIEGRLKARGFKVGR